MGNRRMSAGIHKNHTLPGTLAELRRTPGRVGPSLPIPVARTVAMQPRCEPTPIWLAALIAGGCLASKNGEDHAVRWVCVSGRALYTNGSSEPERIEPLGI